MTPITHVVSLGGACKVAYQLRRLGISTQAFPFDWWMSSFYSVVSVLEDFDLETLYDPALLTHVRCPVDQNNSFITNLRYKMRLYHEFTRDEKGIVVNEWRSDIDRAKTRTGYLRERLLGLNEPGNRVLFVRLPLVGDNHEMTGVTSYDVMRAYRALKRMLPLAEIDLCLNNYHWLQVNHHSGIIQMWISEDDNVTMGIDASWDDWLNRMQEIGLRFEPKVPPPFPVHLPKHHFPEEDTYYR